MATIDTKYPIPKGEMRAILKYCPLPSHLDLGDGIELTQLSEPLGHRGELDYINSVSDMFGVELPEWMVDSERHTQQPCALLKIPRGNWDYTDDDGRLGTLEQICAALSVLTSSPVQPVVTLISSGNSAEVNLTFPRQTIGIGATNNWWQLGKVFVERSRVDPKFSLLTQLYLSSMESQNHSTRIFHYAQLLAIAAGYMGFEREYKKPISEPVSKFIKCLDLWHKVEEIPDRRCVTLTSSQKDPIQLMYWIRNKVAHEGEVSEERHRKCKHPLVYDTKVFVMRTQLSSLAAVYNELTVAVLHRLTWPKYSNWRR